MGQLDQAFIQAAEHRPKPVISDAGGIPVLDLTPLILNPIPNDEDHPLPLSLPPDVSSLVAEVGAACRDWGFFQIVNHGVPAELLDRVHSAAREFFALPIEEKRRVRRGDENPLGYYDTEHTKNVRDWKEVFDFTANDPIITPVSTDSGENRTDVFWNQWPENPPEFRNACEEYAEAMKNLALKLLELLSLSLDLPANRFKQFFTDQTSFLRPGADPGISTRGGQAKEAER